MNSSQQRDFDRLRQTIESATERTIRTPKDFDFLSEQIFHKLHQSISATTLKRIWGYVPSESLPRESTLDLLAQFAGHASWKDYCSDGNKNAPPLTKTRCQSQMAKESQGGAFMQLSPLPL